MSLKYNHYNQEFYLKRGDKPAEKKLRFASLCELKAKCNCLINKSYQPV